MVTTNHQNTDQDTTIRIKTSDALRIRNHAKRLSVTGSGRFSANDIVKKALDAYEEKINKTNDKSSNCVEKVLSNSDL